MNSMSSLDKFKSQGVQDRSIFTNRSSECVQGENREEQIHSYGAQDSDQLSSIGSLVYDDGFYQDDQSLDNFGSSRHRLQPFPDNGLFDDHQPFDILSPSLQMFLEKTARPGEIQNCSQESAGQPEKKRDVAMSLASLKLIEVYSDRFKRLSKERIIEPSNDTPCGQAKSPELSTEEIMRLAGARFIQSANQMVDVFSIRTNPYDLPLLGLSDDEVKKVELAEFLLASADKIWNQQFDSATKLLNCCDCLSSYTGNPVERVIYYFSNALRERIDRETGRKSGGSTEKELFDINEAVIATNPSTLACHLELPFTQTAHFAGIQAIIENVAQTKRVHVIDLQIRNGVQWTVLMQTLVSRSECPLELLKITAVGTSSKQSIEETGERLMDFARTISLPFSFKVVMVSDMLDLKEDLFELDAEETVVVYCEYLLRSLLAHPDRLDAMMRVIRNLEPCIMVVSEVEANHNSPDFVSRFIEALFFFSAYFDCLDACMGPNDPNRMIIESTHLAKGIRNIVAGEGDERKVRNVKIDVWRAFFARFGLEETELSTSSLDQAYMVVKTMPCGSSCTLGMNGKTLLIGWKGTPVHSLSAWKFIGQEQQAVEDVLNFREHCEQFHLII